MGLKFNPFTGNFDTVVDTAVETKYDNSDSGLSATNVKEGLDELDSITDSLDTTLTDHLNSDPSKHDADQIDYERVDGNKKNIQPTSDSVEPALSDLDDAIGSLSQGVNYTAPNDAIVASHLSGIDSALGNITSTINNFSWQASVLDKDLTAPPGSPSTGDRYLIGLDTTAGVATGAWAGQDGRIAEWNGSAWDFTLATAGAYVAANDENDGIYLFGGVTWEKKFFEATTASGFLSKSGFDIQLTNVNDQNIIMGNASNIATSVNLSALGDINGTTTGGLTIKSDVITNTMVNSAAGIELTKLAALTADRVTQTNASGFIEASAVTNVELGHLSGVTSAIQTQLDSKTNLATLTTKGDLYARDASAVTRLGIGANNTVLIADSAEATGMRWGDPNTVISPIFNVISINSNTNAVNATTYLVDSGSAVQITLPAPTANAYVRVKDSTGQSNTNNITIAPNAAETIDGGANFIMDSNLETKVFVSDGTNWFVF